MGHRERPLIRQAPGSKAADASLRQLRLVRGPHHASRGRTRPQAPVLLAQVQAIRLSSSPPLSQAEDAAAINEGATRNGCAAKLPSLGFALLHEVSRVQTHSIKLAPARTRHR